MTQDNPQHAEAKERSSLLWRIGDLDDTDKKRINDWIDHQKNIKLSLSEIVMYIIDRFGNQDVMSHTIKKQLHQEEVFRNLDSVLASRELKSVLTPADPHDTSIPLQSNVSVVEEPEALQEADQETDQAKTPLSENNDIYSNLDTKGL